MDNKKKYSINKPLMLAFSVLLAHHYDKYKKKVSSGVKLKKEFGDLLLSDLNLTKMITTSTTHKASIKYTIETLKKELSDKYLLKNNG